SIFLYVSYSFFFFSSRRRHTRSKRDWSSDVCSSDLEYFKYMVDLLKELGAGHIKVYGGGGGVIIPREIKELEDYGVSRIFSPDNGRELGLQGMINLMLEECDFIPPINVEKDQEQLVKGDRKTIAKFITYVEDTSVNEEEKQKVLKDLREKGDENI